MASYEVLGLLTLPVSTGASLDPFVDPTIAGLMDYLAYWIKYSIDDKLGDLPPGSSNAVPTANRYPWDPGTTWVQNDFPALYLWQDSSKLEPETTIWSRRLRTLKLMYIYDEQVGPGGLPPRYGLINAVDAALHAAFETGRHPSYGYGDDPDGTAIWRSLNLYGLDLISTEALMVGSEPDVDARSNIGSGHVVRAYPALVAEIEVAERVQVGYKTWETASAEQTAPDAGMVISTGDNPADVKEFKTVILPGDGVEVEEE